MKIRNNDKSFNITLKISQITEEFNSTKQKYIETKDESYTKRMNELLKKVENLLKFGKRKRKGGLKKAYVDGIAQINRRNVQKQKLNDIENNMLHRKKKKKIHTANLYERRDCNPINLFDSGNLNKPILKRNTMKNHIFN
jgi:hypothetical protein